MKSGQEIKSSYLSQINVFGEGEAKRLIQGGGVKIDGEKIADLGYTLSFDDSVILQAGKRKFAKLVH